VQVGEAASERCSIQGTLDLIGDRWTLLILRNIFRGVRRFSALQSDLGIAKNLLAERLQRLVEYDVVHKVEYQDRPVRYEYRLTSRGQELSPALVALMNWGDRWCSDGEPPIVLVHDACGSPLEQQIRCQACETEVGPTHIRSRPGLEPDTCNRDQPEVQLTPMN